jgi:hypothetical protein
MDLGMYSNDLFIFLTGIAIMIEWKEREHELNDNAAMEDPRTLDVLKDCGLLKFLCQSMRAQPLMLEQLIGMWDPDEQHFTVRD